MIIQRLTQAFANAIKPQTKLNITEWAAKHVKLARSSRSEMADLTQTPWLINPIEAVIGNQYSEICLTAPVGSGKSTALEILGTYIIAEKPGPMLYGLQTDQDAEEWMQTGLMPALQNCELIDQLWPKNKNSIRKDFVAFSHMPIWIGGCGLSNLQSKSCTYVFLDEVWLLKKSILEEARRRNHDRYGSKIMLTSQAGIVGDDFDIATRQCLQKEWNYKCPNCGNNHPYKFEDLKWTNREHPNGDIIWSSLQCYYQCPTCEHQFEDNVKVKREMAEAGSYTDADSLNPLVGHINFHYNALTVWWISWSKLAIEFLKAKNDAKKGSFNNLRQFNQKRLAVAWDEFLHLETTELKFGDYVKLDCNNINYGTTILTVDVQKQDLWYIVRTWSKTGESKLLECGKVLNFQQVEEIVKRYNLKHNQVFMDSAYRTEEIKLLLAKTKWLGLNGRSDSSFPIKNQYTGKTFRRLYGMPVKHQTSNGLAVLTYYSSNGIKDMLFILKSGNGAEWGIPSDIGQEYINQLSSEVKVMGPNNSLVYKQIKGDNHWLDCEVMQIVAATMHSCVPQIIDNQDEDEN